MSILKKIVDWWNDEPMRAAYANECSQNAMLTVQVDQLKFLLSQAAMRTAPKNDFEAAHSVTPFAYVHPKTAQAIGAPCGENSFQVRPSPTVWLVTPLMPEYGVIYGPNLMPGVQLPKALSSQWYKAWYKASR